jgi:hypothetical protein
MLLDSQLAEQVAGIQHVDYYGRNMCFAECNDAVSLHLRDTSIKGGGEDIKSVSPGEDWLSGIKRVLYGRIGRIVCVKELFSVFYI